MIWTIKMQIVESRPRSVKLLGSFECNNCFNNHLKWIDSILLSSFVYSLSANSGYKWIFFSSKWQLSSVDACIFVVLAMFLYRRLVIYTSKNVSGRFRYFLVHQRQRLGLLSCCHFFWKFNRLTWQDILEIHKWYENNRFSNKLPQNT